MSLVKVAFPESPIELAMAESLLEANDIPYFVHNAGFGGLYPGVQIELYNRMSIMVPAPVAEKAIEVLSVLSKPDIAPQKTEYTLTSKIRMVFEALFFGWFIPDKKHRHDKDEESSTESSSKP